MAVLTVIAFHAGAIGGDGDGGAVMGKQRLVGGDDMFARGNGAFDQVQRDAGLAADQLEHDVDIVAHGKVAGIVAPGHARKVDAAVAPGIAGADGGHGNLAAGTGSDQIAVGLQQGNDAGADRTQACDAKTEGAHQAPNSTSTRRS